MCSSLESFNTWQASALISSDPSSAGKTTGDRQEQGLGTWSANVAGQTCTSIEEMTGQGGPEIKSNIR